MLSQFDPVRIGSQLLEIPSAVPIVSLSPSQKTLKTVPRFIPR